MRENAYLGIDCGTQGTKVLIADELGNALGRAYAPHRLIEEASGAREQEPQWWVEALIAATRAALNGANVSMVRAIGVSGQQHGLVVLDEDCKVIRAAKLWNDTQTKGQNDWLIQRFGGKDAYFERFGIVPLTGYTVSKLVWLRQMEPENFKRIRHILLPHEFLNFWLTGEMAAEWGDASGTGYFDVRTRTWIPEVLAAIDGGTGQLESALPRLIKHDEIVGRIRAEAADELGLNGDCLVSAGGGDNMMGAIGTANLKEGQVTISLGTSSTVYSFREKVMLDSTGNVAPFCSSSGGYLPLVCTMNATNVVTQTLEVLGKTVADIEPALSSTSPGADGMTFLPFLNGERTPDLPLARGSLLGISAINFTPESLIRAAIEGVSFGVLNGLKRILQEEQPELITLIGGGSRSGEWRKLLADASGARIRIPAEKEPGALGAVIQAIYAYKMACGNEVSLEDIAAQCVLTDAGEETLPRPEMRDPYRCAMKLYDECLNEIYL